MSEASSGMSSQIRALIVDDEPPARENLRVRLAEVQDVDVVGTCESGREAVEAIRSDEPDLVFLDVQMPGLDGFDVVNEVGLEAMPPVVFVTAYDEHALHAFEVNALDYLLKPIASERFAQALQRARQQIRVRSREDLERRMRALLETARAPADPATDRLVIRGRGRIEFLPVEEVDYVEAAGDYAKIYAGDRTHLMRATMKELEERLGPRFQRIHRSAIVNLERVKTLRGLTHGEYEVALEDGTALKLSRTYRQALEQAMDTSL